VVVKYYMATLYN